MVITGVTDMIPKVSTEVPLTYVTTSSNQSKEPMFSFQDNHANRNIFYD